MRKEQPLNTLYTLTYAKYKKTISVKSESFLTKNCDTTYKKNSKRLVWPITIHPRDQIKYLGIILDEKLTFYPHVKYIEEKCTRRLPKLNPLMRNTYGCEFAA